MSFAKLQKAKIACRTRRLSIDSEREAMETKSHKTEEPLRGLQEILNKMTPQNFEELVQHALNLSLDTEERLKAAVELIFDNFMSDECYDVDNAILSFRMLLVSYTDEHDLHHLIQLQCHTILSEPVLNA